MFPLLLRFADGVEINLHVMIGEHVGMAAE
jgi:hypothetical protein